MRRVHQRVVIRRPDAFLDLLDLAGNGKHRVAEPVDFGDRFRFRRLDHQCSGHRERHGRRVEAEIDQPLGDILVGNAAAVLNAANVDDAFMRHPSFRTGVEHRIVRLQTRRHVVGGQNRHRSGIRQAGRSHHPDIGIGDGKNACGTERRGADRALSIERRARKERCQMRGDTDRSDARAAAAMRDAEGLVKIQVADIGTELRRRTMPDKGVEVGPVDIDLATRLVNDIAKLGD